MTDVTHEGLRLIKEWQSAIKHQERSRRELTSAECNMTNAKNELGKWMMPDDAKVGETFCVWHGDSLIAVKKVDLSTFEITVRKSGRKAQLIKESKT